MIHLREVRVRRFKPWPNAYPFNIAILSGLNELTFPTPITFLVGENGSGKSTLIEALALATGSINVGGAESPARDPTLQPLKQLALDLQLIWNKRTKKGFFMRSEDFFGFARRVERTRAEMQADLDAVDQEYEGRSKLAADLARLPYRSELAAIESSYGEGVDARSHGESYLKLFQARFIPGGFYLLDEPEAPLSPKRQLAFLVMLHEMLAQDAQFIIATHSPILLGFPGATIYSCDGGQISSVAYEDLEHVTITRDFLTHRGMYLRELGLQ